MDYTKMKGCHPGGDPVGLKGPDGMNTLSSYQAGREDTITLIRAEIERRIELIKPRPGQGYILCQEMTKMLQSLLSFLDTLEESEKPTPAEELEKEIDRFEDWMETYNQADYPTSFTTRDIARHFAKWGAEHAREQMMEEAVEGEAEELYNDGEIHCTVGVGTYFKPGDKVYVLKAEEGEK